MTRINPAESPAPTARTRFLAAVTLFLAWVVFLLILGMLSATGPGRVNRPAEVERPGP